MIIPIHYKYTNYPHAPKATQKSKVLGVMTCFFAMATWSFLFWCIAGGILSGIGLAFDTAYITGAVLLIPFVFGILKLKKHLAAKIDAEAAVESCRMLSLTVEERTAAERAQKKKNNKTSVYISLAVIAVTILLMKAIN